MTRPSKRHSGRGNPKAREGQAVRSHPGMSEASLAEAAAREALAPICSRIEILDATQESFQEDSLDYHDLAQSAIEDIRELIYTSEELK